MQTFCPGAYISFDYRNWRGVIEKRKVIFIALDYGSNEDHPEPCWLMRAHCADRGAARSFAFSNIISAPELLA